MEFSDVVSFTTSLKGTYDAKVQMQNEIVDEFLMKWAEESKVKKAINDVKVTLSPDLRNKILGALRLLIATYPQFKMDKRMNSETIMQMADDIEIIADRMFRASGQVQGEPNHYEIVLSILLFGEQHTLITRTSDLVKAMEQGSKAEQRRAKQIASTAPYIYETVDPRNGFPEWDQYGLRSYYREVKMTVGEIADAFGKNKVATYYKGDVDKDRLQEETLCQWFTFEKRYAWIHGQDGFLLEEDHGLPFIPVSCTRGEGSDLFTDPEDKIQPFAYTIWKSGLTKRQNLMYTVAYTNAQKYGTAPAVIEHMNSAQQRPKIMFEDGLNRWVVPEGGGIEMADLSNIVNPAITSLIQLADQKIEESTIFAQTLGEKLGANAPFSMVALLHQAGRLPLLIPQRKASYAIADMVYKSLIWSREEPHGKEYDYSHIFAGKNPETLPEFFAIDAVLEVSLPQDQVQNANIANALRGMDPVVTKQWILENLLQEQNPEDMIDALRDEKASNIREEQYFYGELMKVEMQKQQLQQIQAGQVAPAGPPVPNGGPIPGQMSSGPGIPSAPAVNPNQMDPTTAPVPPIPGPMGPQANQMLASGGL